MDNIAMLSKMDNIGTSGQWKPPPEAEIADRITKLMVQVLVAARQYQNEWRHAYKHRIPTGFHKPLEEAERNLNRLASDLSYYGREVPGGYVRRCLEVLHDPHVNLDNVQRLFFAQHDEALV